MSLNHIALRRTLMAAGAIIPTAMLAVACLVRVGAQPPAKPSVELAGQKYKNIKVLKNVPADKLIPIMHDWNASLGVKCDFCHVVNADHTGFDRDDRATKRIARTMVTMTQEINKHQKAVDGKATCYLCHHGHPDPETHPGTEAPLPGGGR